MAKRKGVPNVYLWCSKVGKEEKYFDQRHIGAKNCVVKVEGHKKCTFDGKPAKCVETAFIYELPASRLFPRYPKYRKRA